MVVVAIDLDRCRLLDWVRLSLDWLWFVLARLFHFNKLAFAVSTVDTVVIVVVAVLVSVTITAVVVCIQLFVMTILNCWLLLLLLGGRWGVLVITIDRQGWGHWCRWRHKAAV